MGIEEIIPIRYPYLLAKRYEAVQLQLEPHVRIYRIIDLFEEVLRYFTLVGLAIYNHHELHHENVEHDRRFLNRPSLGHWLQLFRSIQQALLEAQYNFPLPPLDQQYKEGPILVCGNALLTVMGENPAGKIPMRRFLDLIVNFRNKKIGHGSLSEWEARLVLPPLEEGIASWLEQSTILTDFPLIYIDRVEWTGYHYIYYGHKLSNGTSIFSTNIENEDRIFPRRVYISNDASLAGGSFIPLFPFFHYDKNYQLLYIFNELSSSGVPLLQCFYSQVVEKITYSLEAESELIVGKTPINA